MNHIINTLYLGNAKDALSAVSSNSIKAIINVSHYENLPLLRKSKIKYFKIALKDSPKTDLNTHLSAFLILDYCMRKKFKTLIHCSAGKSRSASIVILYIMIHLNLSYSEAFNFVKSKRSIIDRHYKQIIKTNYSRIISSNLLKTI